MRSYSMSSSKHRMTTIANFLCPSIEGFPARKRMPWKMRTSRLRSNSCDSLWYDRERDAYKSMVRIVCFQSVNHLPHATREPFRRQKRGDIEEAKEMTNVLFAIEVLIH